MANKTDDVRIRVTPEDKEKIVALAKSLGVSVSALFLFAIGEKYGEKLADIAVDKK